MSAAVPDGAEAERSESGPSAEPELDQQQPDPPPSDALQPDPPLSDALPSDPLPSDPQPSEPVPDQAQPGLTVPAQAPQPELETDARPASAAARKVRLRRTRRFFRRPTVRVISALAGVLVVWAAFSAGQATFQNNGQGYAANLAEWARNHHLGPIVTFGEWLSYNPPKVGGKPAMSLAVPKDEQVAPATVTRAKAKRHGPVFVPDIPAALRSLAGKPVSGEGQWRVVEKVKGEPAILTTFLRDATYTSYVNGIASIDQRLVRFYLRPGYEDPGYGHWKAPFDAPAGSRDGLLATFNGGFKISDAEGGFYLNGAHYDALVNGAASIVYYKNGTVKIGQWGRDFRLNSSIAGVRQNLKLLVDRGRISPNLDQDIETSWGATLGGGYFVWRSGLGITSDGRIVYVYGPALNVQDLAELLRRAGAVEGMQLDINPAWMKFDYYQVHGHPGDPTPVPLLPTQQSSPYSYYDPSTRDFTAVYAR
ncbi:MAG TPA: phosphodiester glycosidase family protein [Trebonia sp.]|nr:phosphodiester glycosidase family protein [Trebonia sp.]